MSSSEDEMWDRMMMASDYPPITRKRRVEHLPNLEGAQNDAPDQKSANDEDDAADVPDMLAEMGSPDDLPNMEGAQDGAYVPNLASDGSNLGPVPMTTRWQDDHMGIEPPPYMGEATTRPSDRSRNWCFTLNQNQGPDNDRGLIACKKMFWDGLASYFVYGMEVAPKTGTKHYQCYIELKSLKSMKQLSTLCGGGYWQPRRGPPRAAAGYCKKGMYFVKDFNCPPYDTFMDRTADFQQSWVGEEFGIIMDQGSSSASNGDNERSKKAKRTDLTEVMTAIDEGATMTDIAFKHPAQLIKYPGGLTKLLALRMLPRQLDAMPEVIVLWGPTGSGKSRDARIKYWPDMDSYVWNSSQGAWWDGYQGQKKIILEEFRGQMTFGDLLLLLDRHAMRVQIKGGHAQIQAERIVICAPSHPNTWYPNLAQVEGKMAQLYRRLTEIVELKAPEEPEGVPVVPLPSVPGVSWGDQFQDGV